MMNYINKGFPGGTMAKNPPASEGKARNMGSSPGWGISPGVGNGNLLQNSCLGNPMNRGAWQTTVLESRKESDTTLVAKQTSKKIEG